MRTILLLLSQLFFILTFAQNVEVVTQEKNLGIVSQIKFGNNGRYVASANEKNFQVKIWDVTSSKLIGTLNGHTSSIKCLAFLPDKKQIVSADDKNNVFFWDLESWKLKDSINHSCSIEFLTVVNNKVLGISAKNEIIDLSPADTKILTTSKKSINAVFGGKKNLYLGAENELQKFDLASNNITTIATPDKKTDIDYINVSNLYTVAHLTSGKVLVYNDKMQLANELSTLSNFVAVDINGNSKLIAASNRNGEVVLYNYETGQEKATLKDPSSNESIRTLSFNASGTSLATSGYKKLLLSKVYSNNNVIQIWDTNRESVQKTLKGDVNAVQAFAFNPVENHLFSLRDQQLDIWSLNSGERLGTIELHERKLEVKDRLADNAEIKKEETKKEVLGTKVSLDKLSKFGKGGLGSLKDKAASKLTQKATETKTTVKEESKLSGKAAFSRFGFQEDKIIISPKGNYLLTSFKGDELRLYSLKDGLPEYIDYVKTGQKEFYDVVFDKEELNIIVGGAGETPVSIVSIEGIQNPISKTLEVPQDNDSKIKGAFQSANALAMSVDGKHLVALFNTGRIVAWSTYSWRKEVDVNPKATMTRHPFIGFSKNGTKLFVNTGIGVYTYDFSALSKSTNGSAELGDVLTLKKAKINGYPVMTHAEMDHLISIDDNNVEFLDVINDKRTTTHQMEGKLITDIQVNKFGFVGISLKNGELKIFDPKTGKERFLMVGQDDNAIFKTPNNYYKVTKEGNELVTFRVGSNAYPFEQFDATNNRPDLVLAAMNSEDQSLITLYKKAFEKRLSKLGLPSTENVDLSKLPSGSITNFSSIPLTTDKKTVTINFEANSKSGELSKLLVWNNDVPIFGKIGKTISGGNYKGELPVNLASGNNKIQVAVLDSKGRESLKETIDVECLTKTKPNLYILSIGTSTYKDSKYNLDYAAKDAKDLVSTFEGKSDIYGEVKTKLITNEEATSINISQLKSFFKDAKIDDVVMVFVAGHGLLDANYDYFYGTYDVNFNDPNKKGLAYEKLEALLDGISPLKKILIMDTCHSGEVEEEELLVSEEDESEEDVMFRAVGPALTTIDASPTKMMKELFTDLRRGTGTTVLSSAGGAEFAMESNDWKNGLFTYSLLFGLRNNTADLNEDGIVMLSELQIYVTDRVAKLSHGKQTPTARIQNIELDYRIW
jgi:WD40 repeat protein